MNKTAKGFADFLGVKVSDVIVTALPTELVVGDEVLAEIQPEVVVRAFIDAFDEADGNVVFLLGDDGEPYCTMRNLCTKVK